MADDDTVRINVWSPPRTLSTSLLYSFAQRPDTHAVDEPLYAHHLTACPHLQAKRPYLQELLASQAHDGAAVVRDVMLGPVPGGKKVVYMKHMVRGAGARGRFFPPPPAPTYPAPPPSPNNISRPSTL